MHQAENWCLKHSYLSCYVYATDQLQTWTTLSRISFACGSFIMFLKAKEIRYEFVSYFQNYYFVHVNVLSVLFLKVTAWLEATVLYAWIDTVQLLICYWCLLSSRYTCFVEILQSAIIFHLTRRVSQRWILKSKFPHWSRKKYLNKTIDLANDDDDDDSKIWRVATELLWDCCWFEWNEFELNERTLLIVNIIL